MLALVYQVNRNFLRKYSIFLILFLAAFNFLIYFLKNEINFPVWAIAGYTTFSAIFALLVYESIKRDDKIINFIFNNPVLRFLGKYSYGFYIFHWPVFLLVRPYSDALVSNWYTTSSMPHQVISAILATLAGLVVSIFMFHAFEKHFLKLRNRFT
jgi:peptidoglycan/LPS O-acetylase OafA/YrhL